jgi:hypothetical protein
VKKLAALKKSGRHKGFTAKFLWDLEDFRHKIIASYWGDIAFTEGGGLAWSILGCGHEADLFPTDESKESPYFRSLFRKRRSASKASAAKKLALAVQKSRCDVLLDAAEFLRVRESTLRNGPIEPAHYYAGSFIYLCGIRCREDVHCIPEPLRKLSTVRHALNVPQFHPTVAQVHEFLGEALDPQDCPDYKTVERICERFGAKAPSRSSGKEHRPFDLW